MENLQLPLRGSVVQQRTIKPMVELDLVNLYSDDMTDVIISWNGEVTKE